MAFCGLCGKEISDGQTFCRECNNNLACPQAESQPVPKRSKRGPVSIICFIAAGLTFSNLFFAHKTQKRPVINFDRPFFIFMPLQSC